MRILVINFAASEGGALNLLRDFVRNIKENDRDNEWFFLLSDHYIEETEKIKIIKKNELKQWINRLRFECITGAYFIEQTLNIDVVFSMQNTTVRGLKIPQILYLHQSLPFQNEKRYSFFKKEEMSFAIRQHLVGGIIKKGLPLANKIIVQTEWLKKSLIKLKIPNDAVEVIPPSIKVPDKIKKNKMDYNSFIYPTTNLPYKNIEVVERAVDILNGRINDYSVEITINKENKKNLKYIGEIPRNLVFEKLATKILIFSSYIETFGLPLAEAKELNTLILAADTEFAREILEEYNNAYFFDKFDERQLSSLMFKCINGSIIRKDNQITNKDNSDSWNNVRSLIDEVTQAHQGKK